MKKNNLLLFADTGCTTNCTPEPECLKDDQGACLRNDYGNMGIDCSPEKLKQGTCSMNVNKFLWINKTSSAANPTLFVSDLILSATTFVGTMLTIALIVMGIKYIMGWFAAKDTSELKSNIIKLIIWLLLVIGSYTIVRVIQYLASWN